MRIGRGSFVQADGQLATASGSETFVSESNGVGTHGQSGILTNGLGADEPDRKSFVSKDRHLLRKNTHTYSTALHEIMY
eukprot:2588749-Amphidinium_carterae.1